MKKIFKDLGILNLVGLIFILSGCVPIGTELSNNSISENSSIGTEIGKLTSAGGVEPYSYELIEGVGSEDNFKFSIDVDKLKLAFVPNYDNPTDLGDISGNNTYAIRIKTTGSEVLQKNDYSSALNNYGGFNNTLCYPNIKAFAGILTDGQVYAWGDVDSGGIGAPPGTDYVGIYSNNRSFVAIKKDGSLEEWGDPTYGGVGAPNDDGYTNVYSTERSYSAIKSDGSIISWGDIASGGIGAPNEPNFVSIYSNQRAFAAINLDKEIFTWGNNAYGGTGAPSGANYDKIFSTERAFAAVDFDGHVIVWGDPAYGGVNAPENEFIKIVSSDKAFAGLTFDYEILTWGDDAYGGIGAPDGIDYSNIYSNSGAFAALKDDGSIVVWGNANYGGVGAPTDKGYINIYATERAFAAMKKDGSIVVWGNANYGGVGAPTDKGYTDIYSNQRVFVARKDDNGSIVSWGDNAYGGGVTTGNFKDIYSTLGAFTGKELPGSIVTWGSSVYGGSYSDTKKFTHINSLDSRLVFDKTFVVNVTSNKTPIYRLYNKRTRVHLYTRGQADRDKILSKWSDFEYTDGEPAFYASLVDNGTTPIYRLYNTRTGVHLYTRGEVDKNKILNKWPDFEFTDSGPAFYASLTDDGTTPIYRLYNKRTGVHLYTKGEADRDKILAKWNDFEFTDEVPAFYANLSVNIIASDINKPEQTLDYNSFKNISLDEIANKNILLQTFFDTDTKSYLYIKNSTNSSINEILEEYPSFNIINKAKNKESGPMFKLYNTKTKNYFYVIGNDARDRVLNTYSEFLISKIPNTYLKK